ncbi:hypothetical protein CL654_01825 [bacterium]|nr:hypothetical protein [bacterium]
MTRRSVPVSGPLTTGWTQQQELAFIDKLGDHTDRGANQGAWRIRCVGGYIRSLLAGTRTIVWPGYDRDELLERANRRLKEVGGIPESA